MSTRTPPEDWRQCWRTPQWLFDFLAAYADSRWRLPCCDAFADEGNALADTWMDREYDALASPWLRPYWYFANPPFRQAGEAVRHATAQVENGAKVIMVLLARDVQCAYVRECHKWWDISILTPRLGYVNPQTDCEEPSPTFPSWVWISRPAPKDRDDLLQAQYLDTLALRRGP